MYKIGEAVTGTFIRFLERDGVEKDMTTLRHVRAALFQIGPGQKAKLPISHFCAQYSDGMTVRRIAAFRPGDSLPLEIIDVDEKPRQTFVTVSETVRAARDMLNRKNTLWTVSVVQIYDKGVQLLFPNGYRARVHQCHLGGADALQSFRNPSARSFVVKLSAISVCSGPWFLSLSKVDPNRFEDHTVVAAVPPAVQIASELPADLAADFIRHVTQEIRLSPPGLGKGDVVERTAKS